MRVSLNGVWTEAAVIMILLHPSGGPLDPSFGTGGIVSPDFGDFDQGNAAALQVDAKLSSRGQPSTGSTVTSPWHVIIPTAPSETARESPQISAGSFRSTSTRRQPGSSIRFLGLGRLRPRSLWTIALSIITLAQVFCLFILRACN